MDRKGESGLQGRRNGQSFSREQAARAPVGRESMSSAPVAGSGAAGGACGRAGAGSGLGAGAVARPDSRCNWYESTLEAFDVERLIRSW